MSRSVVAAMTAYTLEVREATVKLNQNESPFDFPRQLKERALAKMLDRPWNIYPDFENVTLREALGKAIGMPSDNILVGNGSNELLAASIATFVGPETPVIFPRPTFTLYEKLIAIAGGLPVPISFEPESGLLPLDDILEAVRRYRDAVVIVCSPNNPTGGVLPRGGIDELLASGATLLLDRAYTEFEAQPQRTRIADNLVELRTFSKAYGLAALRVGWLASTAGNCREIRKVKLPYSLNIVSETIAAMALENGVNVASIISERERVVAALGDLVDVFPTQANFVTFRVADARAVFNALLARGVLVRDVSSYPSLWNCLRASIGSREENDEFLDALKESL